jgi:hypothetical protein
MDKSGQLQIGEAFGRFRFLQAKPPIHGVPAE